MPRSPVVRTGEWADATNGADATIGEDTIGEDTIGAERIADADAPATKANKAIMNFIFKFNFEK